MRRSLLLLVPLALPATLTAQVTERLSTGPGGVQGNSSSFMTSPRNLVSADGRFTAFMGGATNLVASDTNAAFDVFLRDRVTGTIELVSVDSAGVQANGDSGLSGISVSASGRYVAFESQASNLVAGDTNFSSDIFLRDRLNGTTVRVSVDSSGAQANGGSTEPSISGDGRYIAFSSLASNLVAGDTNAHFDVFLHDMQTGVTERVSIGAGGVQANAASNDSDVTLDGRYVVFGSLATNLAAVNTLGQSQIYVRDRVAGTTECASLASPLVGGSGSSFHPSISDDGNLVCFGSGASDFVPFDMNGVLDVYVRNRALGTTELVSASFGGGSAGNGPCGPALISDDGSAVAFESDASDLVPGDTNGSRDVFVHEVSGAIPTERVNVDSGGAQTSGFARLGSISAGGRFVEFSSSDTNLVAGDTNGFVDAFLRDRVPGAMESACDAGGGGMIACPCSNQPAGAGQGCNNSSNTGGAILSAEGAAYLSLDSLVFTTTGEKPSATSVLLQGDQYVAGGFVFGQGLRCAGGTLRRLFVKTASGGSITAPDFGAGDPGVAARSAQLGTPLQAGQQYAYSVYYRDPIVLGGCSAASTFNATQTGLLTWFP